MTVDELRKKLEGQPPDMVVVLSSRDHNYTAADCARVVDAHDQRPDMGAPFGQYGGEDCETDYGPRVEVFLID